MGQPMPTFLDPTLGEPGPSIAELTGRFCAFIPVSHDPNALNFDKTGPAPKGSVTYHVVVLDGGPLYFGAAPKATPPRMQPTHVINVPAEFHNQMSSNVNIAGALRDHVGKGVVLGVVELSTVGTKGNKPYNITPIDPNDPRRSLAHNYYAGRAAGTVTANVATELTPGMMAPQVQQQVAQHYAPPVAAPAAQPVAQQFTQPAFGQPQPAMPAGPAFQAAQFAPAAPASVAAPQDQAAAFAAWQAQQAAAAVPVAPAAPVEFIPPGFEAAWPHMNTEQRAQMLASYQAQVAAAGQPAPGTVNPY